MQGKANGKGTGKAAVQAPAQPVQGNVLRSKVHGLPGQAVMRACVQPVLHVLHAAVQAGLPQYGGHPGAVQVQAALAALLPAATCGTVPGPRGTGTRVPVPAVPYGRGKGKVPGKPPVLPPAVHGGLQALHVLHYGNPAAGLPGNPQQAQRYYAYCMQQVHLHLRTQAAAAAAAPARTAGKGKAGSKAAPGKGKAAPARTAGKAAPGKAAPAAVQAAPAAPAAPVQGGAA